MTICEGVGREIAAEWERALADAQLPIEKVRVWFTAESPPGNAPPGAQYFYPHQPLEGHGLSPAQLEEAESDACAGLHRVIVHLDFVTAHGELDDET
ncbi:MAG TPA: hypothetical protein VES62_04115 [Thermoleophilaceae bacterium]|jgi:hypothetical protein|nr:hypothetical protein [Thermoleophilaceae bacterium]